MENVAIDSSSLAWMPKSVWGPLKWKELHVRALSPLPMTDESKWFDSFIEGLPCAECRKHFQDFLEKPPADLSDRNAFFQWTVAAHNHVNSVTGKELLSEQAARELHSCNFEK